jgi:Ca-activated chloride channel family protein
MLYFFDTFFAQPWCLLLLLLVPLVVRRWLRRSRPALRYSDTALLASLPPGRSRFAYWGGALLRGAALVALVIGLAGLRWPDPERGQRIPTEGIAIELLVDVSGSMAEEDFDWEGQRISRLEAVKRVFRLFVDGGDGPDGQRLEGRHDDLIGLVTFAHRPDSGCPLTLSHSVVLKLLEKEKPRSIPGESETNLTDAVIVGLSRLHQAGAKRKVMVLLSDGDHNVDDTASTEVRKPGQAANLAGSLHVPIYAIDAGGDGGNGFEPATADATAQRENGIKHLRALAEISGGHYFQARDTKSLLDVCAQIDRLERVEIQSHQRHHFFHAFAWLGLVAFCLFVGVNALELTVWQRLP